MQSGERTDRKTVLRTLACKVGQQKLDGSCADHLSHASSQYRAGGKDVTGARLTAKPMWHVVRKMG